jgi:type VI secretion system protein ImpK
MNPTQKRKQTAVAVDIDALLQDTCLLAVELRQGSKVTSSQELSALCAGQIERVREALRDAGLGARDIEHITHAQCALLDETVLTSAQGDTRAHWANEPLQARYFSRHQAGEFLYEEMGEVLRSPAPNPLVLAAFQRVLMLGFTGRYLNADDPERQQLLAALNDQVGPLQVKAALPTRSKPGAQAGGWRRFRSSASSALVIGLLLIGAWWGLDHLLKSSVVAFMSGRV